MRLTRNFIEQIIAMSNGAGTDNLRLQLRGVYWHNSELLACDGHIAARTIGLNADLLLSLAKCFSVTKREKDFPILKLSITKGLNPIVVTHTNGTGVIMPVRI